MILKLEAYEINDDHNHLIDINSGEIIEFVDKDIEELQKNCKKHGYNLVDHKLELYGSKSKNNLPNKIFIKTFGCQMNEYDSDRIRDLTTNNGFINSSDYKNSDCYIINTCHIRESH